MEIAEIPSLLRSHTANGHVDENQTKDGNAQADQLDKGENVHSLHISHHLKKTGADTTHKAVVQEITRPAEEQKQERAAGRQEQAAG